MVRVVVKYMDNTIEQGTVKSGHWNAVTAHASVIIWGKFVIR